VVWVEWRGAFVSYVTDGSAGLVLSERMSVQMCLNVLGDISREGEDETTIVLINRLCGNNIIYKLPRHISNMFIEYL
jgi:hypothetical protein